MEPSQKDSSNSKKTSSSGPSQGAGNFEFVLDGDDKNHTQVRRHAMRASWRERKRHSSQNSTQKVPRVRPLAPTPIPEKDRKGKNSNVTQDSLTTQVIPGEDRQPNLTGSPDELGFVTNRELGPGEITRSLMHRDKASTKTPDNPGFTGQDPWTVLSKLSSTQIIGSNILDAMSSYPYKIEPQDLELVHFWVASFPKIMYGTDVETAYQHNHSDVWLPLEFSNEASFHGVLAYSAAHLAHLRGDPVPALAVIHNLKSIEIINKWLNDPVMMISDAAIAAVLRQTTLENWWGNDESIRIHRQGLKRMIELRGGLLSLNSNWRLAQTVHILLLVKEPYWFCPERHRSIFPPIPPDPTIHKPPTPTQDSQTLHKACHEFVTLLNELKTLRSAQLPHSSISSNGRYPFVEFALTRLQEYSRYPFPAPGQQISPHTHIEETIRFVTLLYIAVTWRDCLTLPELCGYHMDELNSRLEDKGKTRGYRWVNSIENMFLVVICREGTALVNPVRTGFVVRLMDVARLLDLEAWMGIRGMLFRTLLGIESGDGGGIEWDAETLFREVDGRY